MTIQNVQCRWCGTIYDLGDVHVVSRYADCTVFTTPCCGRQADDRLFKSLPDFTIVESHQERKARWITEYGEYKR